MLENLYNLSLEFLRRSESSIKRTPGNIHIEKLKKPGLIIGQRGVGKTTLILQDALKKLKGNITDISTLYVPCDHFKFRGNSIYETAEAFVQNGGEHIYFDEIHHHENWSEELKSIIDSFPKLRLVATGSSLIELAKGSHDLSRRMLQYELFGLSLREYISFETGLEFPVISLEDILKGHKDTAIEIIKKLECSKFKILPLFKSYLKNGFYPYYKEFSSNEFYLTLQQNIDRSLDSDLLSINKNLTGYSIRKIKRLLIRLSDTSPYKLESGATIRALSIGDERTLYEYLSYLERARIIKSAYQSGSMSTEMNKPEKIYINNTNIAFALLEKEAISVGMLRELFFLTSLSPLHKITLPGKGDFFVDEKYTFEIGGKKKDFNQIKNLQKSFLAIDETEIGTGNKIPVWLFGFLY
jgi:predicted AAA+ superfamily ATPase